MGRLLDSIRSNDGSETKIPVLTPAERDARLTEMGMRQKGRLLDELRGETPAVAQEQPTPQPQEGAVPIQDMKLERTEQATHWSKDLNYNELEAADKQGVHVLDLIEQGHSKEYALASIEGLGEPMYGPDDLIADMVTGFAYSGYRMVAKQGAKKMASVAAKGTAVDVGFGAIAGGAMTAANMATDNMLVTTVSGLLSPAGAKVFFSLSRNSLKQFMKRMAIKNPKVAKELSEAVDKVEVKTKGGNEVKKTVKEQVDENVAKKVKKAQGKPDKPTTAEEAVKPKGKAAKLAAAHAKAKAKGEVKKPVPDKLKKEKSLDEQIKEVEAKEKADQAKDEPLRKNIDKRSGKNVTVDKVLRKSRHEVDGAQVTITDPKSPAKGATLTVEGDPKKITKKQIQDAVKKKEAEFSKSKEEATPKKTKSFTEKEVKGALEEADVKKPKTVREAEMKGEDFLDLTTGSDVRKDAIKKKVKEGKMEGETKTAPVLVVDKDGKVIAHDGRHRAAKAAQEGKKIKTLVVSEDEFLGGTLASQKFGSKDRGKFLDPTFEAFELPKTKGGKVPDLREGITGKGKEPVAEVSKKPSTWSKLGAIAARNKKTGETVTGKFHKVKRANGEIIQKNILKNAAELRRVRKEMIKQGVSPDDIDIGFMTKDASKFIPQELQAKKLNPKRAAKKTLELRHKKIKDALAKDLKTKLDKDAQLKGMAPVKAQHRLVHKDNKYQAKNAVDSWWKQHPDLRRALNKDELVQAVEESLWTHIRRTKLRDLKRYVKGDKQAKGRIGGELNNTARWSARNTALEMLADMQTEKTTRYAVDQQIKKGTFKLPEQARGDEAGVIKDPLLAGIQDPDLRKAAMEAEAKGIDIDTVLEGTEAAAPGKKIERAKLSGDLREKKMRGATLPKKGKAAALGRKEMSKRARKAKRKRMYKRQLEAQKRNQLKIIKAQDEIAKLKAKQAELKAKQQAIAEANAKRITSRKSQGVTMDQAMLKQELKDANQALQSGEFRLGQKKAALAKLQKASKTLEEQGFDPLIKMSDDVKAEIEANKALTEATKNMASKDADLLAKKLNDLSTKGGHFMDMQTLGDIRRIAQRLGRKKLVKEVEVMMMKTQQKLDIRNNAKTLKKTSGGTELYSGLPLHKIQTMLLDPIANSYIKVFDAAAKPISRYITKGILKNDALTWAVSGVVEDFGLSKAYKILRRTYKQNAHKWKMFSSDLGQAIRKIDGDFKEAGAGRSAQVSQKAAQLRARQIAGGGITAFPEKFDAVTRATKRFNELENMLTERGLLKDHQFKRLNRSELAKANRHLKKIQADEKVILDKIKNLKESHPKYELKLNDYTNQLKALENARIEKITRMQIHYKNSGKNYFRILFNTINKQKRFERFIGLDEGLGRLDKRWSIRRENWQVSLGNDGRVTVSQRGKPMKVKSADLGKMIHKGISAEARDAYLFDLFNKIAKSKRWARKSAAPGFRRLKGSGENWGPLAGMYVSTPIYSELMGSYKQIGQFEKMLHRGMGAWKAGKVVWSPRAQARNFLSNIILGDILADVSLVEAVPKHIKNITDLGVLKYGNFDKYTKKVRMSKTDQDITQAFKYKTTLMDTSFAKAEIEEAMKYLDLGKIGKEGSGLNQVMKFLDKAKMAPGRSYQLLEEGMKLTIFRKEVKNAMIEKGIKDLDELSEVRKQSIFNKAEEVANYALFDYSKVPRAVRWARHGYSPFITFTYKAIPRLAKTMVRKPWKAAKWIAGLYAVQEVFDYMSGDSKEDIAYERRNLPDYMQRNTLWGLPGQHSHIRLPWKTEDGRSKYFDVSFILPWGDVSEGFGEGQVMSRSIMPNHPFWNFVGDVRANENVFLDQPLTYKQDEWHEVAIKLMKHAYEQIEPGIFDSALKTADRLFLRPKDWRGRKHEIGNTIADAWFGLKVRNVELMEAAMFKHKELNEEKLDIYTEMVKRYNDITFKRDYNEDTYQEKMDELWQDMAEDTQRWQDKAFFLMNGDDDK